MKSDRALFARLYISCQTRDGDLDKFFKHENQECPPSLSHVGKRRLPKKKYELTECLEANTTRGTEAPNAIDATIIDGAAVVNIHTYIHTSFIGSSPRGFSESILHYKIINQVHDNKNITMIKEDKGQ